jgi:hypothetical protein
MWSDPETFAYERGLARWEGEGGRAAPGPRPAAKPAAPAVSFRVYRSEDRTITEDEQARLAAGSPLDGVSAWGEPRL